MFNRLLLLIESLNMIGKPVIIGETDCSSLVKNIYKNAIGINIPNYTSMQIKELRPISSKKIKVGDLVYPNDNHVMIYIGLNRCVSANSTAEPIKLVKIKKCDNLICRQAI